MNGIVPINVDEFSPGIISIFTIDIVFPVTSNSIDNKDFQYDNDEINFTAIPVNLTITTSRISDTFDSDRIKNYACAYAYSSDVCPSLSDSEKYFDCIDEISYLSPDFICEG